MRWWWFLLASIATLSLFRLTEFSLLSGSISDIIKEIKEEDIEEIDTTDITDTTEMYDTTTSDDLDLESKFDNQPLNGTLFHVVILVKDRVNTFKQSMQRVMSATPIEGAGITVIQHRNNPKIKEIIQSYNLPRIETTKSHIDDIYIWMLKEIFTRHPEVKYLIVLEDDLFVSTDFFDYCRQLAPLFEEDPTIFSIRGWTDHGFPFTTDMRKMDGIYRSEIFIGLGWMISRRIWEQYIAPRKPPFRIKYCAWDIWFQGVAINNNLSHIYPEVPRIYHYFDNQKGLTTTPKIQQLFYQNMFLHTETIVPLGDIRRVTKENYLKEVVWPMVRKGIIVNDPSTIPQYQNKLLIVYHDAAPLFRKHHLEGRKNTTWALINDYFSILAPHGYSRLHYEEMVHFQYGTNRILLIGQGSPFQDYLLTQGAVPLNSKTDFRKPMNWDIQLPFEANQIQVGAQGLSCDEVCQDIGKKCDIQALAYVNTCSRLREHFPDCSICRLATENETVPEYFDAPAYVEQSRKCFTAETRYFNCDVENPRSQRLCVCS